MKPLSELLYDPAYRTIYQKYQLESPDPLSFRGEELIKILESLMQFSLENKLQPELILKKITSLELTMVEIFYIADSFLFLLRFNYENRSNPGYDPAMHSALIYLEQHLEFFAAAHSSSYKEYLKWVQYSEIGIQIIDRDEKSEKKAIQKLVLAEDNILPAYEILKDYFDKNDQTELLRILQEGTDATNKLVYNGAGNQIANFFKVLKEGNLIVDSKKKLERWIKQNFAYIKNGVVVEFTDKYLDTLISTDEAPCKRPLMELITDPNTGHKTIKRL